MANNFVTSYLELDSAKNQCIRRGQKRKSLFTPMNETCCELSYDCTSLATETFTELATGLPIDKILVSVKCPMDGSNVSDRKKNDGLGRIRTGDLRHVKAPFIHVSI